MILFNGLYYRGNWATPFQVIMTLHLHKSWNFYIFCVILQQLRSEAEHEFYKSENETRNIKLMRTRGIFKYADLAELSAQAIELPYEVNIINCVIHHILNFTLHRTEQTLRPISRTSKQTRRSFISFD